MYCEECKEEQRLEGYWFEFYNGMFVRRIWFLEGVIEVDVKVSYKDGIFEVCVFMLIEVVEVVLIKIEVEYE